jgi:membrane dipeptidase
MASNVEPESLTAAGLPAPAKGILCDMVLPLPPTTHELEEHLAARRRAGYSFVSLSMAADIDASPDVIYSKMARMRHALSQHPDWILLVDTVADIKQAKAANKLGIGFHFQGSEPVGRDLANVGAYYKLGVRWMLMAYNFQNNVGTGCMEAQDNDLGLSSFGRELVAEMNRVGMFVDCSHCGYRTSMEAMEISTQPCIFSHSNPRALRHHPRNIRDDQIKACAATGGLIGINGVGPFMGEAAVVSCDAMARQIDHVAELVGPQHIAFGLDYMGPAICQWAYDLYKGDVAKLGLPGKPPWAFFDPMETPALLSVLSKRGYDGEAVRGIMGGNFLRVAEAVWR